MTFYLVHNMSTTNPELIIYQFLSQFFLRLQIGQFFESFYLVAKINKKKWWKRLVDSIQDIMKQVKFVYCIVRCGRVVTDFLPYPKFRKGLLSWWRIQIGFVIFPIRGNFLVLNKKNEKKNTFCRNSRPRLACGQPRMKYFCFPKIFHLG